MSHSFIKVLSILVFILIGIHIAVSGTANSKLKSNNEYIKYTDEDSSINTASVNKEDSILLDNIVSSTNDTTDYIDSAYNTVSDTLQHPPKKTTSLKMDTGMISQDTNMISQDTAKHAAVVQDTNNLSLKDTIQKDEAIIDSTSLKMQKHLTMDTGSIQLQDTNTGPSQPTITVEPTDPDIREDKTVPPPPPSDEPAQTIEDTYEAPETDDQSKYIYKIQIAASKNPLNQQALSNIYSGEKQISQEKENGWYKYAIGNFNSYKNAVEYCRTLQNKNFFVKGYKNGVKFYPYAKEQNKFNTALNIERNKRIGQDKIVYGIQIASATKPVATNVLKLLYHGTSTVYETRVDDYYAYITNLSSGLMEVKEALNQMDIPSAFIVKYENGKRKPVFNN
jgi:hypothetical protein